MCFCFASVKKYTRSVCRGLFFGRRVCADNSARWKRLLFDGTSVTIATRGTCLSIGDRIRQNGENADWFVESRIAGEESGEFYASLLS